MPGIQRRKRVGIVDVTDPKFADKPEVYRCQKCLAVGISSILGGRIILPDPRTGKTTIPADIDNWKQCPTCGEIVAVYQLVGEGNVKVDSDYELSDTAFDFGRVIVKAIQPGGNIRKFDRSPNQKVAKKKRSKRFLEEIKDPDIKREIKEGGEIKDYTVSRGGS